ncbi:nucleotidyltransferase family protein [Peribacillus psychrosaccharolyticus]|uniref:nucleotidyltransferase family protein n=1 Tax=Peribacillus psychrosaccharolyticus TaxID=1407 RepID=UPI003D2C7F82
MKITGIYLAAGSSTRMGTNKLALKLGNKALGNWGLEKALDSRLQEVILLSTAANSFELSGQCTKKFTHIEVNSLNPSQSLSLKTGIEYANTADAVVILLADQPFITTNMINDLIDLFIKNPSCSFVASSFQGCIQPPILIAKKLFPDVLLIQGDRGAKHILRKSLNKGILAPFYEEKLFVDIDQKKDYLFWKTQIEGNR